MAVVESQVVALELEKVLPKVQTLFERDGQFYTAIEKQNVQKVSNRQMRIPLEIRPGGDFGYFNPDGGPLGRGGGQTWDKAVVQCVFMKEGIEYTKLAEWSTDSDGKAVQNAVRQLVAKATDEFQRQIDAQLQGTGNGVVGTISTATAGTGTDTYVLTNTFGTRLVRYGQVIQVFDSTLATNRGNARINYLDQSFTVDTIKTDANITGATNTDVLVVQGISSPTSLPGLFGVPYHHSNASTGTWLGFDRATTPEIRSNGVSASSAALTLPLPRLAINSIQNRVGKGKELAPDAWMHPCQKQAYEQIGQLVSIIQKQASEQGLNMYFGDAMQLAGAPVRDHFSWNKTRIDFVSKTVWGRGELLPLGFYTTDGRRTFELRDSSGGVATADIFYMVVGMQTFVNNPAATAYISSLAIPSGY